MSYPASLSIRDLTLSFCSLLESEPCPIWLVELLSFTVFKECAPWGGDRNGAWLELLLLSSLFSFFVGGGVLENDIFRENDSLLELADEIWRESATTTITMFVEFRKGIDKPVW
jgi:hypothetical protein